MGLFDLVKGLELKTFENVKYNSSAVDFLYIDEAPNKKDILIELGLAYKKKKEDKELYYISEHTATKCDVIGLNLYKEETSGCALLLKLEDGQLVAINSDCFLDMQNNKDKVTPADRNGFGSVEINRIDESDFDTTSFIAFDIETTGFLPEGVIIELGACKFVNGEIVDKFDSLIHSVEEVPSKISKVNGITTEMVLSAPSKEEVYSKFIAFLGDAFEGKTVLVGHNAATFDSILLKNTLEEMNYSGKIRYIDSYLVAKKKVSESNVENYKQITLAEYYGIEVKNAHRACDDSRVCGEIMLSMLDARRDNTENESIESEVSIESLSEEQKKLVSLCAPDLDSIIEREIETRGITKNTLSYSVSISNAKNKKGEIASVTLYINEEEYPAGERPAYKHGASVIRFVPASKANEGKFYFFCISKARIQEMGVSIGEDATTKSDKANYRFKVDVNDETIDDFISKQIDYCFANYKSSSSFGCCSRFEKCSEVKECIHPNNLYATGCQYRRNLEAGRIFY